MIIQLLILLMTSDRPDQWPSSQINNSDQNSDDLSEYLRRADIPIRKGTPASKQDSLFQEGTGKSIGYEKFLYTLKQFHSRSKPLSSSVKTEEIVSNLSTQIHEIQSQQIFIGKPKQRRLLQTSDIFRPQRPNHQRRISHIQLEFSKTQKPKHYRTDSYFRADAESLTTTEVAISHKAARKSVQKIPSQLIRNIYSLTHHVEDFEQKRNKKAKYRANLHRHFNKAYNRKTQNSATIEKLLDELHNPHRKKSIQVNNKQIHLLKGNSFMPTKTRLATTSHSVSRVCMV